MAVISGPLFDKGYLRSLLIVGMIIITVGLMTASVARNFYSIFLSLGLCTGLGMGLVWVPGISAVATYFTTKRPLAGGLAATGAGFGYIPSTAYLDHY
jgi:MFS family permease